MIQLCTRYGAHKPSVVSCPLLPFVWFCYFFLIFHLSCLCIYSPDFSYLVLFMYFVYVLGCIILSCVILPIYTVQMVNEWLHENKWLHQYFVRNWNVIYDAECVSKIKTILSIIFIFTIWGCVSSAYPILWWSRECVLYLIIIIKPEVWIINHCLGLGHETMVCAVCLTMFLCDRT